MAKIVPVKDIDYLGYIRTVGYKWDGEPSDTVALDWSYFQSIKDEVPWPLEVKGKSPCSYRVIVYRLDANNSYIYHRLHKDFLAFKMLLTRAWMRVILTLAVWDLAYVAPGEAPSIKCVGKKMPWQGR